MQRTERHARRVWYFSLVFLGRGKICDEEDDVKGCLDAAHLQMTSENNVAEELACSTPLCAF